MNKNDTIIAYHDFAEWCRDNPHLDLDSRPHSHGGPIGYGGYISDEKTRAAFAAWRAAIEADRKRISDLEAQLEKALTERDDYHDIADQLAEQIAAITNQEIGEHSSGNNPWQNAMLAADEWIAKDIRRLTDGVDRKRRGEPVMYQVRTRPDWNEQWCRWEECTREQAEDYRKAPVLHDLHYEVRELYTAPQPAPDVSALVEALEEGLRAIGDHHAPDDCYATGPMTGDPFRDFVQCPACSFIAMCDAALAAHRKSQEKSHDSQD